MIHLSINSPEMLWPVHLKPQRDELLSSWLVRLAMGHGQKLHTFCSITWPRKAIWNRDIDRCADREILCVLSEKTATPIEKVQSMSLASYEGILFEKYALFGPNPWILPVGVYHRTRKQFGMQYCPRCLAEDDEPYYRRVWRLAFIVICDKHQQVLHDRCSNCGAAVNFHRNELGDQKKFVTTSLTICHICRVDLRSKSLSKPSRASEVLNNQLPSSAEVHFTKKLLRAIEIGYMRMSIQSEVYSLLYFAGLRQIMKILAMKDQRVENLRQDISDLYQVAKYTPLPLSHNPDLQELDVTARRQLLALASCLLEEWPQRFINLSNRNKVWSSLWLRHLEPNSRNHTRTSPFWLWKEVYDHLYRARYCPSEAEIQSALQHLKRKNKRVTNSKLSEFLGVSIIRREGIL